MLLKDKACSIQGSSCAVQFRLLIQSYIVGISQVFQILITNIGILSLPAPAFRTPLSQYTCKNGCTSEGALKRLYVVCRSHCNFFVCFLGFMFVCFCLHCLFLYRTFECEMKIKVWYIHSLKSCLYMMHRAKWMALHGSLLNLL